jgi:hypothetical protein
MKLLIDISGFNPRKSYGALTFTEGFLKELNSNALLNDNSVSVIATDDTVQYFALLTNINFIPVKTPNNPFIRVIYLQFILPNLFKKINPDIIFSPLEIAYKSKKPQVVYIHDIISKFYLDSYPNFKKIRNKFLWYRIRQSLKYADLVLTPSEFTKNEIIHFVKRKMEFGVVKEGRPDLYLEKFNLDLDKRKKIIFIPSYKAIHKPIFQLVSALKVIKETRPEILETLQLIFSGDEDSVFKKLKEEINKVSDKINVINTGFIDVKHINYIYSISDVVLYISDYEGFGLPIIEADFFGVPIVATDLPVLAEISNPETLFYKQNNITHLSEMLIKAIFINKKFQSTYDITWSDFNVEIFKYFNDVIKRNKLNN